jgi:hypothetical protein
MIKKATVADKWLPPHLSAAFLLLVGDIVVNLDNNL